MLRSIWGVNESKRLSSLNVKSIFIFCLFGFAVIEMKNEDRSKFFDALISLLT